MLHPLDFDNVNFFAWKPLCYILLRVSTTYWNTLYSLQLCHSIPINKKIRTLSDFFENWHTCWVHKVTTPDQNLAYSDYSPLRYDWSIFEAIIYSRYSNSHNFVCVQCRALQFALLKCLLPFRWYDKKRGMLVAVSVGKPYKDLWLLLLITLAKPKRCIPQSYKIHLNSMWYGLIMNRQHWMIVDTWFRHTFGSIEH